MKQILNLTQVEDPPGTREDLYFNFLMPRFR